MLPKGYYGRESRTDSGNLKSFLSLGCILYYCFSMNMVSESNQEQLPVFIKVNIHLKTNPY